MKDLITNIKKATVFLGEITPDKKGEYLVGTGFLVIIKNIFHLVTAKHVVFDEEGNERNLRVFCNTKNKGMVAFDFKFIKNKLFELYNLRPEWITTEGTDIAILPFVANLEEMDCSFIPDISFLNIDELYETLDIFYVSFQPGLTQPSREKRVAPIIRRGTISKIENEKIFWIDGFAFPGNSGSPVFVLPSAIRQRNGGFLIGGDNIGGKFIGVITRSLIHQDPAMSKCTGEVRVIFNENTGLSEVYSVGCMNQLITSEKFQYQLGIITRNLSIKP
jgi:hypothetical protein